MSTSGFENMGHPYSSGRALRHVLGARHIEESVVGGVRERRGRLAADDRRGLVDELVVLEGLHHEQGEVHAARDVALENGIAHVPTPHRQALTLALLEVAPRTTVHRVSLANTRRHASTWSLRSAKRARRASGPKTFTIALSFHEYTSWPSRVMCHPHENTRRAPGAAWSSTAWAVPVEYPWTPRGTSTTSTPSHPETALLMTSASFVDPETTVMRPLKRVELLYAFLPTHANHLVAPSQRVLHHVLPELPRGPDDANPHSVRPIGTSGGPYLSWTTAFMVSLSLGVSD